MVGLLGCEFVPFINAGLGENLFNLGLRDFDYGQEMINICNLLGRCQNKLLGGGLDVILAVAGRKLRILKRELFKICLLYTSDAADE